MRRKKRTLGSAAKTHTDRGWRNYLSADLAYAAAINAAAANDCKEAVQELVYGSLREGEMRANYEGARRSPAVLRKTALKRDDAQQAVLRSCKR